MLCIVFIGDRMAYLRFFRLWGGYVRMMGRFYRKLQDERKKGFD